MVQRYSREEKRIWEYFRHGLFLGSQKFIDRIKSKYLSEKPDIEITQKRQVLRDTNPKTILKGWFMGDPYNLTTDESEFDQPRQSKASSLLAFE